jgi:D-lactate dehydrogenase (cytochrome)
MTEVAPEILDRLKSIVGPPGYLSDPADIEPHLVEQRGLWHGATALVLRPASTSEVASLVAICAGARLPIVTQGGNTGLCGGGVPSEDGRNVIIDTGRLNRIRKIDPDNFAMTVEAGCILADVQQAADAHDRLFPLSLGAEGSCRIGGNISTNAGGLQVLRYGNTRELVLGLEVVLSDGRVWDGLRALRKDNTGYDLKQLFIEAEGTLGIVTAATLRLFPKPVSYATAFVGLPNVEKVMALFARARAATSDQLIGFELIPRIGLDFTLRHISGVTDPLATLHPDYVLIELASSTSDSRLEALLEKFLEQALEAELITDAAIASSEAQRQAFWRIREGMVEAQKYEGGSIKHDISVPISEVAAFIVEARAAVEARLPGIRPVPFGHVGDGNIHFNLSQPVGADRAAFLARWTEFNDIVHPIAAQHGGSISAEHGLGRLKRNEISRYKAPVELELMAALKRTLDPLNIMNPGKLLPDGLFRED